MRHVFTKEERARARARSNYPLLGHLGQGALNVYIPERVVNNIHELVRLLGVSGAADELKVHRATIHKVRSGRTVFRRTTFNKLKRA